MKKKRALNFKQYVSAEGNLLAIEERKAQINFFKYIISPRYWV